MGFCVSESGSITSSCWPDEALDDECTQLYHPITRKYRKKLRPLLLTGNLGVKMH